MRCRPLGATGLQVSEVGFGTWGIGGDHAGAVAYGPTDDRVSRAALDRALALGVNFFDTADWYGHGHSETLLGAALAGRRDDAVVATKAGYLPGGGQDFSPAHLRAALAGSLARLQTDYTDVFLLHDPPREVLRGHGAWRPCLEALVAHGQARAWGVSAASPADALFAADELGAPVVEFNFNLADQRARQIGLLDACRRHRTGCVIRTPLCFGFLTGQVAPQDDLADSDHRRRWSAGQRQRWIDAGRAGAVTAKNEPAASPALVALRYCLAYDAVSTVIPGMLTPAQVEENAAAGTAPRLPAPVVREIEAHHENAPPFVPAPRGRPASAPRAP